MKVPGFEVSQGMLSNRLAELEGRILVEGEVLEGPPIATVHRLTTRGEALRPALIALGAWAETHMLLGRGRDVR